MKHNKIPLVLGLLILSVFILFSLFPSFFAPYGPKDMDQSYLRMSRNHLLGTNDLGYDIFSELIYASKNTLIVGLFAAFISLFVGSFIGIFAGYLSSWKGELANGLIQIFLMLPMLPMAIVLGSFVGGRREGMILTIALLGWSGTAKTVRVRTMQLKETSFIEGLIILGLPKWRILICHIIPNLYDTIASRFVLSVTNAIMVEATLSFLGLSDPTEVTWGRMINLAYRQGAFLQGAYSWLFSPGLCIALVIIALYSIDKYIDSSSDKVKGSQSYLD